MECRLIKILYATLPSTSTSTSTGLAVNSDVDVDSTLQSDTFSIELISSSCGRSTLRVWCVCVAYWLVGECTRTTAAIFRSSSPNKAASTRCRCRTAGQRKKLQCWSPTLVIDVLKSGEPTGSCQESPSFYSGKAPNKGLRVGIFLICEQALRPTKFANLLSKITLLAGFTQFPHCCPMCYTTQHSWERPALWSCYLQKQYWHNRGTQLQGSSRFAYIGPRSFKEEFVENAVFQKRNKKSETGNKQKTTLSMNGEKMLVLAGIFVWVVWKIA